MLATDLRLGTLPAVLRGALFAEYLIVTRVIISRDASHGGTAGR
jgi:hypothetical protein